MAAATVLKTIRTVTLPDKRKKKIKAALETQIKDVTDSVDGKFALQLQLQPK